MPDGQSASEQPGQENDSPSEIPGLSSMDVFLHTEMQKGGIVDTIGGALVAVLGYGYLKNKQKSFVERWIVSFLQSNPRLFRRGENE